MLFSDLSHLDICIEILNIDEFCLLLIAYCHVFVFIGGFAYGLLLIAYCYCNVLMLLFVFMYCLY